MRVLMVSKACIVGTYQTKLEILGRQPDIELSVIVPPAWKGPEGITTLERQHTDGYELIVSPIRFNGRFHLHYYPELGSWIHRLRPDILHVDEEPYNLATYLALRAGMRAQARTLFFSWQNLHRRYPWPFGAMERAAYRMADYALVGNEDACGVLRRKGYGGPVEVIPQFGVVPEYFSQPTGARLQSDGVVRIGYGGRLVPEKGVDLLLRALAGVDGPWQATIVGKGPEEQALQALAGQLGIGGRVEFRGALPSSQMAAFYGTLDILALPSRSRPNWAEQFGRVLVEAMASGVAVVGSSCGEIPRVIGDGGLVFPEGDVAALSASLQRLVDDRRLRERLAQVGRARVLAHYTQERIVERTCDVYRRMLGASFGPGHSMV